MTNKITTAANLDIAHDLADRFPSDSSQSPARQFAAALRASLDHDGFPSVQFVVLTLTGPAGGNPLVRFFGGYSDLLLLVSSHLDISFGSAQAYLYSI